MSESSHRWRELPVVVFAVALSLSSGAAIVDWSRRCRAFDVRHEIRERHLNRVRQLWCLSDDEAHARHVASMEALIETGEPPIGLSLHDLISDLTDPMDEGATDDLERFRDCLNAGGSARAIRALRELKCPLSGSP